jgi:hypothetical protein
MDIDEVMERSRELVEIKHTLSSNPASTPFLLLGYMGVPVAFAIMAGVLLATALTPVSFPSMIGQIFHGLDHGESDPALDHGRRLRRDRLRVDRRAVSRWRVAARADRLGLMIYSYFFGPIGTMKPRAPLVDIFVAARLGLAHGDPRHHHWAAS